MLRIGFFTVGVLGLAGSATVRALDTSRVADGRDHRSPRENQRHIRQGAHARETGPRAWATKRL